MQNVYLDNNATTAVASEVREAMEAGGVADVFNQVLQLPSVRNAITVSQAAQIAHTESMWRNWRACPRP